MTPAEFRARMPAFGGSPPADPVIQRWLDEADELLNESAFGSSWDRAVALWVAHHLVVEGGFGKDIATAGQVTQKGVGMMLDMMSREPLMRTVYGQQFLELRATFCAGPVAV